MNQVLGERGRGERERKKYLCKVARLIALNDIYLDERNQRCDIISFEPLRLYIYICIYRMIEGISGRKVNALKELGTFG